MLLDSFLEKQNVFSDEEYLKIHSECIYYPTNLNVVDIIMRANPSGVIEPVKFQAFLKHETRIIFVLSKKT